MLGRTGNGSVSKSPVGKNRFKKGKEVNRQLSFRLIESGCDYFL